MISSEDNFADYETDPEIFELDGLDTTINVPEPSEEVSWHAMQWISHPETMLVAMTDLLNQVLQRCCYVHTVEGCFELRLKPNVDPMSILIDVSSPIAIMVGGLQLARISGAEAPFDIDAVKRLERSLSPFTASEFNAASDEWKYSLMMLAHWLEVRRLLKNPPSGNNSTIETKKTRTATFDDYREAWQKLEKSGIATTRKNISRLLKAGGEKTLSGDAFTRYRQAMLKVRRAGPSAVRPPKSVD